MMPLRRHQLVRLSGAGWATVLERQWDRAARACLEHWAARQLPLVVTRQLQADAIGDLVGLGLPAPLRWDRRRLALQVPCSLVRDIEELPKLSALQSLLSRTARAGLSGVMDRVAEGRATARVYGSYGWQALSELDYVRPGSDLDLWVAVKDAVQADVVASALSSGNETHPRLDGELMFGDGAAVNWREWSDWRAGRTGAILVKRLKSVELQRDTAWCCRGPSLAIAA